MEGYMIYVVGTFGEGYTYDKVFKTIEEAIEFLESIGGEYREQDSLISPADYDVFWYDRMWDIVYWIVSETVGRYWMSRA